MSPLRNFLEAYGREFKSSIIDEPIEFENSILQNIDSRKITFGGVVYPEKGWFVTLLGGPGSGKGAFLKNNVLIDAPLFGDVDRRIAYANIFKNITKAFGIGTHKCDLGASGVAEKIISVMKPDEIDSVVTAILGNGKPLSNIVFEAIGSEEDDYRTWGAHGAHSLGYKTSLIWVANRYDEELARNQLRKRPIENPTFSEIHLDALQYIPKVVKSRDNHYDEVWFVFDNEPVQLQKSEDSYIIPEELMKKIKEYMDSVCS